MSATFFLTQRRRSAVLSEVPSPPDPPPPSTLLGVGSFSSSLDDYPKTGPVTDGDWYVATNGSNSNDGTTINSPFATIQHALSQASDGDTILVRGGTYNISNTISLSSNLTNGIMISGYGTEIPILDGSGLGSGPRLFSVSGRRYHLKSMEWRNVPGGPLLVGGSFNTFEEIYVHSSCFSGDPGGALYCYGSGASDNLFLDCAVWGLGDGSSTDTNTPDCYRSTTGGSGAVAQRNKFVRCLAANGADDNFDFYYGAHCDIIDCVSVGAGWYWNGNRAADGGLFKLGSGQSNVGNHVARGNFGGWGYNDGLGHNGAPQPLTLESNTIVHVNDVGVDAGSVSGTVVRDNISLNNGTAWSGTNGTYNSWNLSVTPGNVSFASPSTGDFSLMPGSSALGAGSEGDNLGASTVALEILKKWWDHSGIYLPGRGNGSGGTGLPGDS